MTSDSPLTLLGGRTAAAFLRDYWQRRPLLIRGAVDEWPARLGPGELAGLALEEEVESRVVMGETAAEDWTLLHGPFSEAFFADTPERDWTLLVQDVDKHLPVFSRMLRRFDFLPQWRLDDLMISYAAPGGTVGPHVDSYDVFLLQASGHRRWSLQTANERRPRVRDQGGLRLVADFTPDQVWDLAPGDMLYLPPGIPHYGVATDECITWSIGFRAPSASELLTAWARWLADSDADDPRFGDPGRAPAYRPGAVAEDALAGLRALLCQPAATSDACLDDWIGRYLSEPKSAFDDLAGGTTLTPERIERHLAGERRLIRNPAVRLLYLEAGGGQGPAIFVHGTRVRPVAGTLDAVLRLADGGAVDAGDLATSGATRRRQLEMLADWYAKGWIWFEDELA